MTETNNLGSRYLRLLEPWYRAARKHLYRVPGRPGLACYGPGCDNWGVQTNQKACAAFAVLSAAPGFEARNAGASREEVAEAALKTLRFSLQTHIEGEFQCLDGVSWGHTWISQLGLERMMPGVEALWERLSGADRDLLRRVLVSECDWLLDGYRRAADSPPGRITAGRVKNNHPENNIWCGCLLHRAAAMYPDAPRAAEYREKGSDFLVNGLSVEADAADRTPVDGRPAAERFVGANFFDSWALNHHGYLNVGYMAICLSNLALLHFSCRIRGWKAPEALYRHLAETWGLVELCTFPDGRLLRIGGDTRVRYCYCQDYAIPAWLLALDRLGDGRCPGFEAGWLGQVEREAQYNGDGSFLSRRCADLARVSPLYYTRLESDRAATLAMGAWWRSRLDLPGSKPGAGAGGEEARAWSDAYHGAGLVRGGKRIASWAWRGGDGPTGLCLPPGDSSLAEWRHNLAGDIRGMGTVNYQVADGFQLAEFPGGFLARGESAFISARMVAEGEKDGEVARQVTVFAALPDGETVLVMQAARTPSRTCLAAVRGVFLQVPNDLFNGGRRVYRLPGREIALEGPSRASEVIDLGATRVSVDGRLELAGVYGIDTLYLRRPGRRQVGLAGKRGMDAAGGMLHADEICFPCLDGPRWFDAGAVLYDLGFALRCGPCPAPGPPRAGVLEVAGRPGARAMVFDESGGERFILLADLIPGRGAGPVVLPVSGRARDLAGGEPISAGPGRGLTVALAPGGARLFRLEP